MQGGSSITQQMVKQTLLTQAETKEEAAAATDDTYARKLRELRYAIAFEKNYSKDWILERYLNIAYFGDGAYGIQSAARHYFSKNAKNLNHVQSALLAGLVKNPTGYDPTNSPERALNRRNVVLDRMAQLGVIDEAKAERLKERKLGLKIEKSPNGCQQSQAPFFCDYVVNYLMKDKSLGETAEDRRRLLQSGGLTIQTTIDLDYQKAADQAVSSHVYPTDQAIGGLAMVEPGTGYVKALAQSRPMGKDRGQRPDLPQLRRPAEVRRRQRLPGRLDVQGLRARLRHQPGHPAQHLDPVPADHGDPRRGVRDLQRPLHRRRRLERLQLHR